MTLALFWDAPRNATMLDPIFGRSLDFYLFTLPALQLIVRMAADTIGNRLLDRRGVRRRHRRCAYLDGVAIFRGAGATLARLVDQPRRVLLDARRARVPGTLRAAVPGWHSLCGCHLHRRPRHLERHAGCLRGAGRRRGHSRDRCGLGAAPALAAWRRGSSHRLLPDRRRRALVCQRLYRRTEPAGARATLHRPQYRNDAPGLRARPHRDAPVSRRHWNRGGGTGQQPDDAREHKAVGLAGAAGYAPPDSGNPDLLRLSRISTSIDIRSAARSAR